TFTDARKAESAGAEGIADRVTPHIAARAQRVVAKRGLAPPRSGRRIRVTTSARVQQTDHTELGRLTKRRLACDVRVGIVGRALNAVPLPGIARVRVTHRAFFALRAGTRSTFLVVRVGLGNLLGLDRLLLLLGSSLKVLANETDLFA